MRSKPNSTDFQKIGKVLGIHEVMIHFNFGFNIFRVFRSTGGQIFCFPTDFALLVTVQQCCHYGAACDDESLNELTENTAATDTTAINRSAAATTITNAIAVTACCCYYYK